MYAFMRWGPVVIVFKSIPFILHSPLRNGTARTPRGRPPAHSPTSASRSQRRCPWCFRGYAAGACGAHRCTRSGPAECKKLWGMRLLSFMPARSRCLPRCLVLVSLSFSVAREGSPIHGLVGGKVSSLIPCLCRCFAVQKAIV